MGATRIPKEPPLRPGEIRAGAAKVFPFDASRRRYFGFARNALHAALAAQGLGRDDEVLLPAFHCVSLVEPVLRAGARCRFYAVDRRLETDPEALAQSITDRTRAVVVVHFFGFPQPLAGLREACESRGALLIEDCCHALFSHRGTTPLGTEGHLSLFSLRKTLPVVDGALLVANHERIPLPEVTVGAGPGYEARMGRSTLGRALRRHYPLDAMPEPADASARGPAIAPRQAGDGQTPLGWLFGYDLNPALSVHRGSRVSDWVARHQDAETVRRRRRDNYTELLELLDGVAQVRAPRGELPGGVCPWTLPLDAGGRPGLDRRLRAAGIPAFTFGEVLHSALPEGMFPDAEYLALNLVQLPIHQGVERPWLERMAAAVRQITGAS